MILGCCHCLDIMTRSGGANVPLSAVDGGLTPTVVLAAVQPPAHQPVSLFSITKQLGLVCINRWH